MDTKIKYIAPQTEAVELIQEGFICQSFNAPAFSQGDDLPFED